MREEDIDEVLRQAARAIPGVDPALRDHITGSMRASMKPVRPLPPSWMLIAGLVLVCAAAGTGGALLLGPRGVQKMNATEIALIFPGVGLLICLAAVRYVGEMIPGSRRSVASPVLPAAASAALVLVFAVLFNDYRTGRFVRQGIACLTAGLLQALPAAIASWWLLHRGFAVDSVAAGLAQGTLAGLAGVGMLELHCVNFEAPHVMLWHTAVIPLSGVAGAFFAWARLSLRRN